MISNLKENRNPSSLAPIYFVGSFEPFLLQETGDNLRKQLKTQGFINHTLWQVDAHFDWDQLLRHETTVSLFEAKSLIELRCPQAPSEAGTNVLTTYIKQLQSAPFPLEQVVLILCEKPTLTLQKSSWFQALLKVGKASIHSLSRKQWPFWLRDRLNNHNLMLTQEAFHCLSRWTEGNPSAAAQGIEVLSLLYPAGLTQNSGSPIQKEQVLEMIEDQTHFNLFSLTDAIFHGEIQRCVHILKRLEHTATEPTLVLWIIMRDLRVLASLLYLSRNQKKPSLSQSQSLLFQKALHCYQINDLPEYFTLANQADRVIKGAETGNPWVALQNLSLRLAKAISPGISMDIHARI